MGTQLTTGSFSSAVIVSANEGFRRKLLESLRSMCSDLREARGGAEALAQLEAGEYQAVLLDHWLPDLNLQELLGILRKRHPQTRVVVLDSSADESGSQQPLEFPLAATDSTRAKTARPRAAEETDIDSTDEGPVEPLPGMIGSSQAMQKLYRMARLVAQHMTTVLLTGETGTGKELVARGIHLLSNRFKQPFVTVNCAAIPESLLEAELFGYARGAFTGAFQSRMGRIHAAHGGTLFLDEVGDLPLTMQAKLLRFLQEGEVQRLGGPDVIRVDVRVIAATNADLTKRVSEKVFREDLYYRLCAFPIDLVPLRQRTDDILPLGSHFLQCFCHDSNLPAKSISESAARVLGRHPWPGNVRELQHVIERAFILSENNREISQKHIALPPALR